MTQQSATGSMPPLDSARFDEAHAQLMKDGSIQFDVIPFVPPKPPAWLDDLIRVLASEPVRWMFWILVGLGVLVALYAIIRSVGGIGLPWRRRRTAEEQVEQSYWQPEAAPARALLREADALAAQGRFDEAAHLLLFRSIEDIDSRRPKLVRPALTSRDIAGQPDIPERARSAFNAIVMTVERSLFGGRSLGESDWKQCRSAYESFAFAEAWR